MLFRTCSTLKVLDAYLTAVREAGLYLLAMSPRRSLIGRFWQSLVALGLWRDVLPC